MHAYPCFLTPLLPFPPLPSLVVGVPGEEGNPFHLWWMVSMQIEQERGRGSGRGRGRGMLHKRRSPHRLLSSHRRRECYSNLFSPVSCPLKRRILCQGGEGGVFILWINKLDEVSIQSFRDLIFRKKKNLPLSEKEFIRQYWIVRNAILNNKSDNENNAEGEKMVEKVFPPVQKRQEREFAKQFRIARSR